MPQVQTQIQSQKQEQQLRLSTQQLQLVKLLELPIAEFEERVQKEQEENPALEEGRYDEEPQYEEHTDSPDEIEQNDTGDDPYSDSNDDKLDLSNYSDDDLPVYAKSNQGEERNELPLGDSGSFIEDLENQIMNLDLDETQVQVIKYLIGLLDNRGFIDTTIPQITDLLAFNENIYVDESYVEEVLNLLKNNFEPAGIGAKDMQECLLLQIDRELNEDAPITNYQERFLLLQRAVIADHYSLFINRNKEKLQQLMHLKSVAIDAIFEALKKRNVNPGFALSEATSTRVATQIPDFIVQTDPDGNVELTLNSGEVPRLHVSRDFVNQLKSYQSNPKSLSRGEKEGMLFTRQKVEAAQMFIESIKQRRHTLYHVMKAILDLQHDFVLSKDEADKRRLVLKDVAEKSGYDISTVSRVTKNKCCLLDGRTYQLDDFFKLTRKNAEGTDVDGSEVRKMLTYLVDHEDKNSPFTDDQLVAQLSKRGVKLARRTVAKYRKELGIPQVADRKS